MTRQLQRVTGASDVQFELEVIGRVLAEVALNPANNRALVDFVSKSEF